MFQAVARHSEAFCGLPVNWKTEVLITAGATEALAAAFLGLVSPGDEVPYMQPIAISVVMGVDYIR